MDNIIEQNPSPVTLNRTSATDVGLLLLRVVFGGLFAAAGLQKLCGWFGGLGISGTAAAFEQAGYPPGPLFAATAGVLELIGGTLLLVGLFTPLAAAIVIGVMINAVIATLPGGLFGPTGYQLPLLYGVVGAALACTGAGAAAMDHGRPWHREGPRWAAAAIVLGAASAAVVLLVRLILV